jgi:hypothetical protein
MTGIVNLIISVSLFIGVWWIFGKVYDYTMDKDKDKDKKK